MSEKALAEERMVVMKKKGLFTIVMILIVSLVLTACRNTEPERPGTGTPGDSPVTGAPGEPDPAPEPETPAQPEDPGRVTDEIVRIMTSRTYTMETRTYVEFMGREFEVGSTIAKNGDEVAMKTDFGGMDTSLLMRDEKLYLISHDQKRIMVMKGSDMSEVPGGQNPDFDLEGITYSGTGTGEFRGETYSYEEYTLEKGMIRFYFEDSRIVGMVYIVDQVEAQMEILSLEERVDETMFELPTGYRMTDTTKP